MIGIHLPLLILLIFFACPANANERENNICVYFFVASKYLLFLWKEFYLTFIWIIGFKLSCLLKSLQILGCNCTDADCRTTMPLVAVKVPTITDREILTEAC